MNPSSIDPARGESFPRRHLGLSESDRHFMLEVLGYRDEGGFLADVIPAGIRASKPLELPVPIPESAVLDVLKQRFRGDARRRSLIGQGYFGTITPPVIKRNIVENPAWYTAYTPYQPEISQGRLEALLNFQTMITELTGLPVANASLLDEATAVAEAVAMAHRLSKVASNVVAVDRNTHPQTLAVLRTRMEPVNIEIQVRDILAEPIGDCFSLVVSWPGSDGGLPTPAQVRSLVEDARARGAIAICATDLLALALLVPPGQMGFDVAVGSSQRFGVPMAYGGPHAAFIATTEACTRALPGRLVGVSTDTAGRPALRLALQTREQHIRREKATSNICTAQVLLANVAGMYGVWHGADGLRAIASRVNELARRAAAGLSSAGFAVSSERFFDTVRVNVDDAEATVLGLRDAGYNVRRLDERSVSFSIDETCDETVIAALLEGFGAVAKPETGTSPLPDDFLRADDFMTQSVFRRHQTEHEMLRYLRRLADKDLALDRTMIPLGSCTMKLNATVEMEPITWPEFSGLHPFVPEDESVGIRSVIRDLERMLVSITGYDAVSLQPNAGSQGEFAGLLAIRGYHRSRGESGRDVCLIPASAHGTNAASAVMAGMRVVVVSCDDDGNIDLDDLRAKASAASGRLAAIMITYPSTHGVFEESIGEVCDIVHAEGGQVYLDGANFNALVGTAQPGKFGADVSHLNLHKTFCIPHGGGGPGVGPVAVRAHLAPFLPGHPLDEEPEVGAVSAAPHGSAGILAIPWVYIMMMGPDGLLQATTDAILAANYVARRLDDAFPVLYRGANGLVAHECILNVASVIQGTGLTIDDVAKRLMDHCIHAPTMSFPVANTLMVEPTESESREELDRFCEAMLSIRAEIEEVRDGQVPAEDSVLRHAPHTVEDVVGDWGRPYSRETALYPLARLRGRGYFPPVSRIDAAHGDRNLVCTCSPIEAYAASLEMDSVPT